jgi:Protein of unknown function (DUF3048) N-terminal domain/Protein of unknown function (DUF3048) C-terminal domain
MGSFTSKQGFRASAAVCALIMLAAACGGGSDKKAEKKSATTTTTNPKVVPVAPLTGLPDPKRVSFKRPAVTVKINNNNLGKQQGIEEADVVYEEVVEGATRLAAIFNSQAPDTVGPVRSVRKTDQSIVWPIGGIFAYSGGAQYAIDSIDTAPVKQLDETRAGDMMFRSDSAKAPFNLFAHVDEMYKVDDVAPVPPPSLFTYRKAKAKVGGDPVAAFSVGFTGGFATSWAWDAKSKGWVRTPGSAGASVYDADGNTVKITPKNVVVMFVQYDGGVGNEGSEAVMTGTGPAWVFTGGKVVKGTWTRPDKEKPAKLTNASGHTIKLAPGQTWVELPDVSYQVTVLPPAATTTTAKS